MAHRRSRDGAVAPVELRAGTLARDLGAPGATCRPSGSVRVTARCRSSRAAAVSTGLLICRQAAYLKVSSIRRASGIAPLSPKPPASSADVSPHGSSSNAVGSACVSAMICVPAWNPCRANTRHPGRLSAAGRRTLAPASRPGSATARPRLRRPADAPRRLGQQAEYGQAHQEPGRRSGPTGPPRLPLWARAKAHHDPCIGVLSR